MADTTGKGSGDAADAEFILSASEEPETQDEHDAKIAAKLIEEADGAVEAAERAVEKTKGHAAGAEDALKEAKAHRASLED